MIIFLQFKNKAPTGTPVVFHLKIFFTQKYEIYNPCSLQGPPYRRENYLHVEYGFPFFLSERVHIVKHHFIFLRLNKEYFVQIYGLCKGDISPFFCVNDKSLY